jgi:hypothetical protein
MASRMHLARTISVAVFLALILNSTHLAVQPSPTEASINGQCDSNQGYNNSHVYRDAPTGTSGPWITKVSGSINGYNYSLCQNPILLAASGSSAWVSIISTASINDTVQIGFIKCQIAASCGNGILSHLTADALEWFYAWGTNNPTMLPFPWQLGSGPAPQTTTSFNERLVSVSGVYHWEFYVNGSCMKCNLSDSFRNWNREVAEVSTET